jgi:CPA2 family monovalent cation:H+ antiporter-2
MLASHTLLWIGVPLARIMRRLRSVREEHYGLLRGLFHGASDEPESVESAQPRLQSVTVPARAYAAGHTLGELGLEALGVQVRTVRRTGSGKLQPEQGLRLEAGDVVVLLGAPDVLAAAETRLLQG